MIIEQCPVDFDAAEDRQLIERISMLLAGGTFTFLIEDSDWRRVKSWTPTVTGNVHHAGYRKNLFLRNQTSLASISMVSRAYAMIFLSKVRAIENRISNLNETEVLYRVTRIAVLSICETYDRSCRYRLFCFLSLDSVCIGGSILPLFLSLSVTCIYLSLPLSSSLSLPMSLLPENNKFPAMWPVKIEYACTGCSDSSVDKATPRPVDSVMEIPSALAHHYHSSSMMFPASSLLVPISVQSR